LRSWLRLVSGLAGVFVTAGASLLLQPLELFRQSCGLVIAGLHRIEGPARPARLARCFVAH
jgi:hypothetical protein